MSRQADAIIAAVVASLQNTSFYLPPGYEPRVINGAWMDAYGGGGIWRRLVVGMQTGYRMIRPRGGSLLLGLRQLPAGHSYYSLTPPPLTTAAHPGREEGLFSWVSVNFLLGNLQATGPKTVAAIVEMGGASLQVLVSGIYRCMEAV